MFFIYNILEYAILTDNMKEEKILPYNEPGGYLEQLISIVPFQFVIWKWTEEFFIEVQLNILKTWN